MFAPHRKEGRYRQDSDYSRDIVEWNAPFPKALMNWNRRSNLPLPYHDFQPPLWRIASDSSLYSSTHSVGRQLKQTYNQRWLVIGGWALAVVAVLTLSVVFALKKTEIREIPIITCKSCLEGKFQTGECEAAGQPQCTPCATCPQGFYIQTTCQERNDTVCVTCQPCQQNEVLVANCEGSTPTVCIPKIAISVGKGATTKKKESKIFKAKLEGEVIFNTPFDPAFLDKTSDAFQSLEKELCNDWTAIVAVSHMNMDSCKADNVKAVQTGTTGRRRRSTSTQATMVMTVAAPQFFTPVSASMLSQIAQKHEVKGPKYQVGSTRIKEIISVLAFSLEKKSAETKSVQVTLIIGIGATHSNDVFKVWITPKEDNVVKETLNSAISVTNVPNFLANTRHDVKFENLSPGVIYSVHAEQYPRKAERNRLVSKIDVATKHLCGNPENNFIGFTFTEMDFSEDASVMFSCENYDVNDIAEGSGNLVYSGPEYATCTPTGWKTSVDTEPTCAAPSQ